MMTVLGETDAQSAKKLAAWASKHGGISILDDKYRPHKADCVELTGGDWIFLNELGGKVDPHELVIGVRRLSQLAQVNMLGNGGDEIT